MGGRHVHAGAGIDHRRLQQFGEFDELVHALLRAGVAIGDDDRVFGGHHQARGFTHRIGIAGDLGAKGKVGNLELALLVLLKLLFLQLAVRGDEDWA